MIVTDYTELLRRAMKKTHKPHWITGRHKTRGGRDQDRWRRLYDRVKRQRESQLAWIQRQRSSDDDWKTVVHLKSMTCYIKDHLPPGWITLEVNDDCDFVKDNNQ